MNDFTIRLTRYLFKRIQYLFNHNKKILSYPEKIISYEKRILEELENHVFSENIILTTYFSSKKDPQRNCYVEFDDYNYIKEFYESVIKNKLYAVIFHDNLSECFVKQHTCKNIFFIKCTILYYSLNDERFFIYKEFIETFTFKKILMTDVNDVTFKGDPFSFIRDNIFYIGRDDHSLIRDSLWLLKKTTILTSEIKNKIPELFMDMPLVNAGVIGANTELIREFLTKLTFFLSSVDNDLNNNMVGVNIIFYDSYWLPFHRSLLTKIRHLRTSDLVIMNRMLTIQSKSFFLGYPFTSRFKKFENNTDAIIIHK